MATGKREIIINVKEVSEKLPGWTTENNNEIELWKLDISPKFHIAYLWHSAHLHFTNMNSSSCIMCSFSIEEEIIYFIYSLNDT
jgi:hypothetical protein